MSLSAEAQHKPEASPKAFAATSCGNSRVIASDKTVAETTAGKIRGFRRNGVYIFKGVPYGASTAGPRRCMPPASPEPWSGIRNTLHYGRVCPNQDCAHFNTDGKNLASTDEDAFVLHRGASATI
ncbi:MAG TPA: carboxylesterase family protein, partial [Terriglobales bacterium]|nr:carboxylesterase family protein [Terriglobales bacterium]